MFEWDEKKAKGNKSKHGISFADTFAVFEDHKRCDDLTFPARRTTLCHYWNGRFWPDIGSSLLLAARKYPYHFRTQGSALRGETI
jgi:hypothetical protein